MSTKKLKVMRELVIVGVKIVAGDAKETVRKFHAYYFQIYRLKYSTAILRSQKEISREKFALREGYLTENHELR